MVHVHDLEAAGRDGVEGARRDGAVGRDARGRRTAEHLVKQAVQRARNARLALELRLVRGRGVLRVLAQGQRHDEIRDVGKLVQVAVDAVGQVRDVLPFYFKNMYIIIGRALGKRQWRACS